ncbi:1-(5-phosphoribosyl)-5-[(5-phosphoribosylamino) methylideneamino] imidazole-4-carboxamide isomerase [Verrucomicrobiota bacterium]|nr:1-(5-phosphoribosyl)-5-[(5-phosphoribosylamino) methylideneamino] imidazole-4-carboxamide isomerase [Verrucomicrobiota bacterium]
MRDRGLAEQAYAAGASRVVIGTRAATDPAFLREMAKAHGPRLAVGIDAKDGLVAVKGWTAVTALRATEFAKEAGELGVSTVIYTDIDTDGMLTGPNWASLEAVLQTCPCGVIASGRGRRHGRRCPSGQMARPTRPRGRHRRQGLVRRSLRRGWPLAGLPLIAAGALFPIKPRTRGFQPLRRLAQPSRPHHIDLPMASIRPLLAFLALGTSLFAADAPPPAR